jgi:hypothetical protein
MSIPDPFTGRPSPYHAPPWTDPTRRTYPDHRPIPGMPPGNSPSFDPTRVIPTTAVVARQPEPGISISPFPDWASAKSRLDALPVDGEWTITISEGEESALVARCGDRGEALKILLQLHATLPPDLIFAQPGLPRGGSST